jgi:hypothetical protein
MNFDKLMEYISRLDIKYFEPLDYNINSHLQEAMDTEGYYDNDPQNISTFEILDEITDKVSSDTADVMLSSALEFCITNEYPLYNENWNCINYLLDNCKTWFTAAEKKYLKALNNSYMSIYKVISVEVGNSITLQCQIEKKAPKVIVYDKSLSNSGIPKDTYLATRVLKISPTAKNSKHILSSVCFEIPPHLIKECISVIRNITDAMTSPLAIQLFGNEAIENNSHNKLLTKKMWSKEILEIWYSYYTHNTDPREVLDYDGNPWHPCMITFDLKVSDNKIRQALRFIPKFKFDEECEDGNTWLWLDKKYENLNERSIKDSLPADSLSDTKFPSYQGEFIANNIDNQGYHIFAVVKLHKDKLLVDVNSKQRANIAQDAIATELGDMISNPKIISQS